MNAAFGELLGKSSRHVRQLMESEFASRLSQNFGCSVNSIGGWLKNSKIYNHILMKFGNCIEAVKDLSLKGGSHSFVMSKLSESGHLQAVASAIENVAPWAEVMTGGVPEAKLTLKVIKVLTATFLGVLIIINMTSRLLRRRYRQHKKRQ